MQGCNVGSGKRGRKVHVLETDRKENGKAIAWKVHVLETCDRLFGVYRPLLLKNPSESYRGNQWLYGLVNLH